MKQLILSIILALPLTAMAQDDCHGYRVGDVLRKQQEAVEFEYDANGQKLESKYYAEKVHIIHPGTGSTIPGLLNTGTASPTFIRDSTLVGLFGESTGGSTQPYKYNGKEFDRSNGIDWYDYGWRWYNPAIVRWNRMDRECEGYYSVSPFAYCGNNPIAYIDLAGDSLTLSGQQQDINAVLAIYDKGMGGYYHTSVDENGVVSITQDAEKDPSKMSNSEIFAYQALNKVVTGEGMANYVNDIGVLMHETYDAYLYQAVFPSKEEKK